MEKAKETNTDLIGGLIMVLTAIFFWSQIGNFTRFGILFPRAIILILFLVGLGLLIKAKLNPSYAKVFQESEINRMLFIAIIGLAWVLLLNRIGFAVTSFAALTLSMWILEEERNSGKFIRLVIIAACEVALFYLVFSKVLLVPLPTGLLF